MKALALWQRWLLRCALIIGFWTLLGLVDAAQLYFYYVSEGKPILWWRIFLVGFLDWYMFALATPGILWLGRRVPITRERWLGPFGLHLLASIGLALLVISISVPILQSLNPPEQRRFTPTQFWYELFFAKLHLYALLYWLVVGAQHALTYARKSRERELKATQLETRLAQAQLQVLKMQLHPHFLFNTLNAISALIHQNPDLADRMVARLGELLRLTLENADAQEVPLRQELAMINPYLEIQQSRLGSRLAVRLDIAPDTMDAQVPNLVLQPLVEDAIQRGIAPRPGGGKLEVKAQRIADKLQVVVSDAGPPLPNGHASDPEPVALSNTRTRLQQMYGAGHRFTFEAGPFGSHVLTLEIPFHQAPSPTHDSSSS